MDKKNIETEAGFITNIGITEEELKEIQNKREKHQEEVRKTEELFKSGYPLKMKISRIQKPLVDKYITPFYELEHMFIQEQKARGNAEATITYYKLVFRKLYAFFSYNFSEDAEEYRKILKADGEEKAGSLVEIVALESDNLQGEFRHYLSEVIGNNEQTIQNNMRGLRAIVKFAMENDFINPVKIKVRDIEPDIKGVFTDEEVAILSQKPNPDNYVPYRNWMIVRYIMATGNRAKSIAELKVRDFNYKEKTMVVNTQKNKRPAILHLSPSILRELEDFIWDYRTDKKTGLPYYDEPLFVTAYYKQMTSGAVCGAVRDYCKKKGLSKASAHLLRHTFSKNFITSGGNGTQLMRVLGHSSAKMTNRYVNLYGTKELAEEVDKHALIEKSPNTRNRTKLQRNTQKRNG